ncbi:MAG: 5-oxoprolinase subunit PxpA [Schlesneria sp.]
MPYTTDLNCDVGESFGAYKLGCDSDILDYITSANIACGFHAGDPTTMRATVRLALEKGVAIGAHPGLPDLVGFGRRLMKITPQEAKDIVVYQIGALAAFVKAEGGTLRHVKPHGALYNMAAKDLVLAKAIAEAIFNVDPELILVGQSGSRLIEAGKTVGLQTASEVFADRTYEDDGTLTPRDQVNSVITDHELAVRQVIDMLKSKTVWSRQGTGVSVNAETICIHGDSPHALDFAKHIRKALDGADIAVQALRK